MYKSCLDEQTLDELGHEPLWQIVRLVRRFYHGEISSIHEVDEDRMQMTGQQLVMRDDDGETKATDGLTAAVAFLHSRGSSQRVDVCWL